MIATTIQAVPKQFGRLAEAFELFTNATQKLEQAYDDLQQRFVDVNAELAATNDKLNRKVAELDGLSKYLNNIISSMRNGLVAVDTRGQIVAFNAAAEHILGRRARDVAGEDCDAVMASPDADASPLRRCLQTGSLEVREREIVDADGQVHIVESSISPILDSDGNVRGAVEIFHDLTEVKRLRERIHRMDKLAALGEMASSLAHEIRNPLNGIEGFASLLERDLDPDDKRRQFAHHIVEGSRSLNKTVTDMLLYTRPQKLDIRPTRASEVAQSALLFAQEDLRQRGVDNIAFQTEFDDADEVDADADQLRQALLNIVLNAAQAMNGAGGQITIFTRSNGKCDPNTVGTPKNLRRNTVQIGIADNGPGMDDKTKANIFNPFFTTRTSGTGLGLAIVHKIVDLHSGDIVVDTKPGQGTTFYVNLPQRAGAFANVG